MRKSVNVNVMFTTDLPVERLQLIFQQFINQQPEVNAGSPSVVVDVLETYPDE